MGTEKLSANGQNFIKAIKLAVNNSEIGDKNIDNETEAEKNRVAELLSDAMVSGKISAEDYLEYNNQTVAKGSDAKTKSVDKIGTAASQGVTEPTAYSYKGIDKRREKDVKQYITNAANDKMQTLSTLKDTLANKFESRVFDTYKNELATLISMMGNYDSKQDIEKLEKTVKQNFKNAGMKMTDFQKSILTNMVKLAEKDQIVKEAEELINIYKTERDKQQDKVNFATYENNVIKAINENGLDSKRGVSYRNEALYLFKQYVDEDAYNQLLIQEVANSTKSTAQEIKDELRAKYKDDKVMLRLINEKEGIFNIKSRGNTFNERREELKTITPQEMEKGLGKKLTGILFDYYLNKHQNEDNKTYDMSEISDVAEYRSGADYITNISLDSLYSELENIKKDLSFDKGLNLTDGEIKKIEKFIKMEYAKRERLGFNESIKDADYAKDATMGALANLPGIHYVSQRMVVTAMSDAEFKIFTQALTNNKIQYPADPSKLLVDMSQEVFDGIIGPALGGAAVAILADLLWKRIIGDLPDEKACANIVDNLDKALQYKDDPEGFKQELRKYTKDESIAKKIGQLVDLYVDKETKKFDVIGFLEFANKNAGPGSKWNCAEINGALLKAREEIKVNEKQKEEVNPEEKPVDSEHKYSTGDISGSEEKVDVIPTNVRHSSWDKIAAQYDCLTNEYGSAKTVRMIKIAQGITDMDYSKERMERLMKLSYAQNWSAMKQEPGFDFDTFWSYYKANVLTTVKLPENFAGCKRNDKDLKAPKWNGENKEIRKANGPQLGKIPGSAGKYGARFDGGQILAYGTMQERDQKVAEYKKDHPNATVEKFNEAEMNELKETEIKSK